MSVALVRLGVRTNHIGSGARAIAMTLTIAACGQGFPDVSIQPIDPTIVPVKPGQFVGVTWADEETLVVGHVQDPDVARPVVRPWSLTLDGSQFEEVGVVGRPPCLVVDYLRPQALSQESVAMLEWCSIRDPNPSPVEVSLVAIDLGTGARSKLAALDSGTTGFAWNSDRAEGIASVGSGICQGLGWVREGKVVPIEVEVGSGDDRFALGADLLRTGTDCDDLGRADAPVWSANGSWIYFAASPPTAGGMRRLAAPWDLYVMDADQLEPRRIVQSVTAPLALAADADGGRVAISGTLSSYGAGIWLVVRDSGAIRKVCSCSADALAFSPGGSLAAVTSPDMELVSRVMVFPLELTAGGCQPV